MILTLDVETSIFNKGHPFDKRNFLVSYANKCDIWPTTFHYYTDPDFLGTIRDRLYHSTELVGFNIKFDLHWCRLNNLYWQPNVSIWDCSLAEFVLSGQQAGLISLNEALSTYGEAPKLDLVAEYWKQGISTEDIPVNILEEYNKYDVEATYRLRELQQQLMSPEQINLVYLMGEDLKTLQDAEYNGITLDMDAAVNRRRVLEERVSEIHTQLSQYLPNTIPNPPGFNFDSGDQLSALLYGGEITYDYSISEETVYASGPKKGLPYTRNRWFATTVPFTQRFRPIEGTEVKKTKENVVAGPHIYQVDEPTLKQLKSKKKDDKVLVESLLQRNSLKKVVEMIDTILNKKVEMNWNEKTIHGQFNQNIVVTGRLSSSGPNLQNTPVEVDELLISRYS